MGLKDKINQIIEYLREWRSKPLPTPLDEYGTGENLADFIASHGGVDVSDKYPIEGNAKANFLSDAIKNISENKPTEMPTAVDRDARQAINAIIQYLQEDHDLPEIIGDGDGDDQIKDILDRIEALERRFYPSEEELKPILLPPLGGFWAKITGSSSIGGNRWKYSWEEVKRSSTGYSGWTVKTDGRSGTLDDKPAYNLFEFDGKAPEAVSYGTIVRIWRAYYKGGITYWFGHPAGASNPPTPTESDKGKVVYVKDDLTLGYTTSGTGSTGIDLYIEKWIDVQQTSSGDYDLNDGNEDWRGRTIWISLGHEYDTDSDCTPAEANDRCWAYGTGVAVKTVGKDISSDCTVLPHTDVYEVRVRATDGHLYLHKDATTYRRQVWIRAQAGPQKDGDNPDDYETWS